MSGYRTVASEEKGDEEPGPRDHDLVGVQERERNEDEGEDDGRSETGRVTK